MARLLAALVLTLTLIGSASARPVLDHRDWAAYRERFITLDGRVVDTGNGGVSHSEGQGYGMLLAAAYGDRGEFERLWRWTDSKLRVRDDGLLAWLWDPARSVTAPADRNPASDGDLLVAWALVRAGAKWQRADYLDAARDLARAIAARLVREVNGHAMLLPGVDGFVHDGMVTVNPSYWLFPAFDALDRVAPSPVWRRLRASGLELIGKARFGRERLPPDWLLLSAPLRPSPRHDPVFGFNALRIPLHLVWGGIDDPDLLGPFLGYWRAHRGEAPAELNLVSGGATPYDAGSGAEAIAALTAHAMLGTPISFPPLNVNADDYFSASLLLLSKVAYAERFTP